VFIDRTKIRVHGGDGGNGVTAFRREKFVPRGGPSGGDGGRGGDVWIVADESVNTLLHLRYNPLHLAKRGLHGEGSNRSGKEGADAIDPGGQLVDGAGGERRIGDAQSEHGGIAEPENQHTRIQCVDQKSGRKNPKHFMDGQMIGVL